jgi:O-antigen/teichoic acid export membrane protein
MTQVVSAISVLGLPVLASDFGKGNFVQLRQKGLILIATLTGLAVIYEIVISMLRDPLEQVVYGGKYAPYTWLIIPLGLVPVFIALSTGFSILVRSIQKPRYYFISSAITAVTGIVCSLFLIKKWGIGGAAWGLVSTYIISFFVAYYFYRRWFLKSIRS